MGEFQLNNFLYRIELIDLFFFLSSCLPYYFYYTYSIQPKSKKFLFLFCLCVFRNWEMNVIRKWLKILLVLPPNKKDPVLRLVVIPTESKISHFILSHFEEKCGNGGSSKGFSGTANEAISIRGTFSSNKDLWEGHLDRNLLFWPFLHLFYLFLKAFHS